MKRYYKILKIASSDLIYEQGGFPISAIIPYGPPFQSKTDAKEWLENNVEQEMEYALTKFYTALNPSGLVKKTKTMLEIIQL